MRIIFLAAAALALTTSMAAAADAALPSAPKATPLVQLTPNDEDDGYYYGTRWPACQYRYHFWCRQDIYGQQVCGCWPDPGLHTGW